MRSLLFKGINAGWVLRGLFHLPRRAVGSLWDVLSGCLPNDALQLGVSQI